MFWLVLYYSSFIGTKPGRDMALTTIEFAEVTTPSAPAKPAPVPPVPDPHPAIVLPLSAAIPALPAAAGNGSGEGCGMAGTIGRAIASSPEAMAALAALPPDVRTDADAVMLWNGGWIDVGGAPTPFLLSAILGTDPLAPLKQSVVASLDTMPPECLELSVTGPQLIPIVEPDRTTMLVIGSGIWKWTDLIDPAVMPSDAATAAASGIPQTAMNGATGN